MGREDQVAREAALARQRGLQLGEVAVVVPHAVRPEVLGHLAEQQLPLGRAAGAGDARGGVDHHLARLVDQAVLRQWQQRQQRRGRVAARVRDQLGGREPGPRDLREAVHRLGGEPEIGRQVDGALARGAGLEHVATGHAVRQRRQHDLGASERRVVHAQQRDAVHGLARGRVRGGKDDRGPRVSREQPQQLLPDVAGGPEYAHGDR